jgi:heme-degrading monooxygenase HmoA
MVTMLATVLVAPDRAAEWEQVWSASEDFARQQPGFHAMRLLRNVAQPDHHVAMSDWESRNDYEQFVRASGLNWLDRAVELWGAAPPIVYEEVRAGTQAATETTGA